MSGSPDSRKDPTPALEGADIVLISAGVARKPGMDRSDLFNVNAGIVRNLVEKLPNLSESINRHHHQPVNTTVAIAAEVLKKPVCMTKSPVRRDHAGHYPFQHLCGGTERQKKPQELEVPVIGGHLRCDHSAAAVSDPGVSFSDAEIDNPDQTHPERRY